MHILLLILVVIISLPLHAQSRYALVMGNSYYDPNKPLSKPPNLPNPHNDAKAIAKQLRSFNFQVSEAYD